MTRFRGILNTSLVYGTVLSVVALLAVFLVLPVATIVAKAFVTPSGFGLDYFSLLFANSLYREAIYNSAMLASAPQCQVGLSR